MRPQTFELSEKYVFSQLIFLGRSGRPTFFSDVCRFVFLSSIWQQLFQPFLVHLLILKLVTYQDWKIFMVIICIIIDSIRHIKYAKIYLINLFICIFSGYGYDLLFKYSNFATDISTQKKLGFRFGYFANLLQISNKIIKKPDSKPIFNLIRKSKIFVSLSIYTTFTKLYRNNKYIFLFEKRRCIQICKTYLKNIIFNLES